MQSYYPESSTPRRMTVVRWMRVSRVHMSNPQATSSIHSKAITDSTEAHALQTVYVQQIQCAD